MAIAGGTGEGGTIGDAIEHSSDFEGICNLCKFLRCSLKK